MSDVDLWMQQDSDTDCSSFNLGVLDHINEKWDVMTKDDCVPVHIALQLMDHSSLGRGQDYEDFRRTSRQLQKALKAIVNGQSNSLPLKTFGLNLGRTPSGFQQFHRYIS